MTQYNVTGMSCAACQARVEKAVSKVPGVKSCAVSLLTNSMGVEGDAPAEAVIRAVTDAGYGASLKNAEKEAGPAAPDYENELKGLIRQTDMIVFVMPLYYYNWPAQLKNVVDRFYSFTTELTYMHKKTVLLAVAWDGSESSFAVTKAYYEKICEYMQFEDCGAIYGTGCGTPDMTERSGFPEKAYELGRNL